MLYKKMEISVKNEKVVQGKTNWGRTTEQKEF